MYYQIGTPNGNNVTFVEEERIVGGGKFPKVAINDDNQVIEVHEGILTRRIYYNVGHLHNQHIRWERKAVCIGSGRFPAVAVHGNGVVITYNCAYIRYMAYYRIGTINEGGTAINFGEQRPLFTGFGITETSIAINCDFAVAAGRGWTRILCAVGRFQDDGARIEWINQTPFDSIGYCPTICLDDDRYTVMVWQSLHAFQTFILF